MSLLPRRDLCEGTLPYFSKSSRSAALKDWRRDTIRGREGRRGERCEQGVRAEAGRWD